MSEAKGGKRFCSAVRKKGSSPHPLSKSHPWTSRVRIWSHRVKTSTCCHLYTTFPNGLKPTRSLTSPQRPVQECTPLRSFTRHGTGSTLLTDQGRSFMPTFFKETCKILGIREVNTLSYYTSLNGMVER